ncbi:MAG: peptidoglycan DD-metalloendopeptidase family protein [Oscillospiraceae bacterium]|nr:peptidoglycan DD-metalloendopeptidase family protein [Oscillospiraceae bacterium]
MSELSNLIFHNNSNYISSPYGPRKSMNTSKGATSGFHNGVDYATYNVKLAQYPVTDGVVLSCGTDWAFGGAKYVWVKYDSLGVKMLHYHLDTISVKKGQAVNKNTVLGYTGKTGRATGIHLHLGLKKLSGGGYIDPEKWWRENPSVGSPTSPLSGEKPNSGKKYKPGNYRVTKADVLNVRAGAGTKYKKLKFNQLTASAQSKILNLTEKKVDGYVKGLSFTVTETALNWGKTPSGWVCLDYCEVLK